MAEMNTGLEEFFNAYANHILPWVRSPPIRRRTIPRDTGLCLLLLWRPAPTRARDSTP